MIAILILGLNLKLGILTFHGTKQSLTEGKSVRLTAKKEFVRAETWFDESMLVEISQSKDSITERQKGGWRVHRSVLVCC